MPQLSQAIIRSKMDSPEGFVAREKGEGPLKMGTDAKTKSQVTNSAFDRIYMRGTLNDPRRFSES